MSEHATIMSLLVKKVKESCELSDLCDYFASPLLIKKKKLEESCLL